MMLMIESYGTLSSFYTDIMLILDNINADGTVATVKPFVGYFYRDNNCIGVRFGYRHMSGTLDNTYFDAGEGKAFEDGKLTLEDLRTIALRDGEPKQISGKQELYEMIVNLHI